MPSLFLYILNVQLPNANKYKTRLNIGNPDVLECEPSYLVMYFDKGVPESYEQPGDGNFF